MQEDFIIAKKAIGIKQNKITYTHALKNAIVAGTKYAKEIFAIKGCKATIISKDGSKINPKNSKWRKCLIT